MKILGIVLAVLMLAGSAFVGVIGSNKARDVASDLAKLDSLSPALKAQLEKETGETIPSKGRLSTGAIVGIVAALAAVALLIVTFAKRNLVPILAAAAVGLTFISAVVYPYVKTGPMDGMAPRTQAIVAGVLALIGAAGSWLAMKKSAQTA